VVLGFLCAAADFVMCVLVRTGQPRLRAGGDDAFGRAAGDGEARGVNDARHRYLASGRWSVQP